MLLRVSAAFFPLFSPLNIYISLFSLSARSLPVPSLLPCFSCLLHSPGARPSVSLSPPFLPSLRLSSDACSSCRVSSGGCRALPSLLLPLCPRRARLGSLRRPSVCRAACLLLVRHQAQNAMTVGADAPRVCPRPCSLFMCCRCLFRCPFRGFRPCVRVCVLPCVVWW